MSKSVKSSQPKRSATNSSTAAERKQALSINKDIQRQTQRTLLDLLTGLLVN
jgi:hypothetical protein